MFKKQQITTMQFMFLIHGSQMGVGVLSLPKDLAIIAGTDGWIGILFGWLFASVLSILIIKSMDKYPNQGIVQVTKRYFGKWLSAVIILFFACYLSFFSFTLILQTVILIKTWVLPRTNPALLFLLLLVPTFIIAKGGVKVIGRYAELTFFFTFFIVMMVFIPVQVSDWIHLLPILKDGWGSIFESVKTTIFSFLGFEIIYFIYPFLLYKKNAIKAAIAANTLTMLIYVSTTIAAFAFYSPDAITIYYEPLLNLASNIRFRYIDRLDIIILPMYMFVISTTWIPYVLFTVTSVGDVFKQTDSKKYIILLLTIFFSAAALIEIDWDMADLLKRTVTKIGTVIYIFTVFLFFWSFIIRKVKSGGNYET
ncbi:endospore germination permease [Bacillus sp. CGMCC 1.16541]|uniref:GerAB/ArcD/ProY family transporter n=1 Tax=Bacillus sp. CGMCC 1.16541 TaxID=2185143 RepID=UPI000D72C3D6|nr:endospore germination permease [Bacillus sp. CGMCC 1.16541]